jgi:exopolysaccharide biosynthesis operon protein EpsL
MSTSSRNAHTGDGVLLTRLLPLAACLLASSLAQAPAAAGTADAFKLVGSVGYTHDDNLFRLPDGDPGFNGQRSDNARQALVGAVFDKTYGRQRILAHAKRYKVKFDTFGQLDYDGKDYLASLDWVLGNRFDGKAGASYVQILAPYTDFRSTERNLRIQRRQFLEANWHLHPDWQLRGGYTRDKFSYELPIQRFNDRDEKAYEAGFDYTPKSGSTAGIVFRRVKGNYLNERTATGIRVNDDFTQDEVKARVNWKVTPITSVQVLAGRASRKHKVLGLRDAKGFNGRVTASLHPRQKLRVSLSAYREFAAIESNIVPFSLNRGYSAGASWDLTPKLRIDGNVSRERRNYEGLPASLAAGDPRDTLRQASLNATWTLRPTVQLTAGVTRQQRRGSALLGTSNFKSNAVTVAASAQF